MENEQTTPIVLITGASQGLGYTIAQFLVARGYDLIITARNWDRLQEAAFTLDDRGVRVHAIAGDVRDPEHRDELDQILRQYGRLNLLVNNASTLGPLPMRDLMDTSMLELQRIFEVNVQAPLALIRMARPYLANAKGLVVNLSSDAAVGGYAGWGGYGSSKAALDLMSLTLANELSTEGIGVVSVDPGDMRTAMHQDAFPGEDISDRPLPEVTIPFWAWLLGQDGQSISGKRFQAQGEIWQVAA